MTRVLVVAAGRVGGRCARALEKWERPGLTVMGVVLDGPTHRDDALSDWPVLDDLGRVEEVVEQQAVDQVIFALPPARHGELFPLIARLAHRPLRLRVVADRPPPGGLDFAWLPLDDLYLVDLWTPAIPGWQRRLKRLLDITVAVLGLAVLAPVLAAIALAIKLEDGGPALYRSQRVGENGRLFAMLKFRSMVVDAAPLPPSTGGDSSTHGRFCKKEDDPRVTRVGRLLRRTSLDELPQLWNILRGDMSLVGPRPELSWLLERHQPWQWPRFAVPQGLTGWWQVNGRGDSPGQYIHPEDDLHYVRRYSLWLDLVILWKTVAVVFEGKGSY